MHDRKKKGIAAFVTGALFIVTGFFLAFRPETPEILPQVFALVGLVAEFLGFKLVFPDVE